MINDVHVRSAQLEYSEGQLFGRLVPYNVVATVADILPNGKPDIYREGFRPGTFARQAHSAEPGVIKRVAFWHTHDHQEGAGYFGPARSLEDRDDGLYGEFRVLTSKRDDLRDLLDEGHADLSIEFRDRAGTTVVDDGVRWRTDGRLGGVALDPSGAYPGAEVLAYRSIPELIEEMTNGDGARERAEAEETEAERLRVEAEAEAALEAAGARAREMADIEEWLAGQQTRVG